VSFHGSPWLYFVSVNFLNFDFNADPGPAFLSIADPDLDPASKNNAYPDPQTWLLLCTCNFIQPTYNVMKESQKLNK